MAQTPITSNNLSPLVLIMTRLLCIVSTLSIGARAVTKVIFSRSLSREDYTSFSALVSLTCAPSKTHALLTHSFQDLEYRSISCWNQTNREWAREAFLNFGHFSNIDLFQVGLANWVNEPSIAHWCGIKATCASNILYPTTLGLSELSVLLLVKNLPPLRRDRQIGLGMAVVLTRWTATGVIQSGGIWGAKAVGLSRQPLHWGSEYFDLWTTFKIGW